jgi:hypothetical protein
VIFGTGNTGPLSPTLCCLFFCDHLITRLSPSLGRPEHISDTDVDPDMRSTSCVRPLLIQSGRKCALHAITADLDRAMEHRSNGSHLAGQRKWSAIAWKLDRSFPVASSRHRRQKPTRSQRSNDGRLRSSQAGNCPKSLYSGIDIPTHSDLSNIRQTRDATCVLCIDSLIINSS